MDDGRIRISVSRSISSWCMEDWYCNGPIPDNWDSMTPEERFGWAQDNVDDVYTIDEWPEETLAVHEMEVEND